jgi:DnaJ-class molecular chaperone
MLRHLRRSVVSSACDGTGVVKLKQTMIPGRKVYAPRCPKCDGKGKLPQSWWRQAEDQARKIALWLPSIGA